MLFLHLSTTPLADCISSIVIDTSNPEAELSPLLNDRVMFVE